MRNVLPGRLNPLTLQLWDRQVRVVLDHRRYRQREEVDDVVRYKRLVWRVRREVLHDYGHDLLKQIDLGLVVYLHHAHANGLPESPDRA